MIDRFVEVEILMGSPLSGRICLKSILLNLISIQQHYRTIKSNRRYTIFRSLYSTKFLHVSKLITPRRLIMQPKFHSKLS